MNAFSYPVAVPTTDCSCRHRHLLLPICGRPNRLLRIWQGKTPGWKFRHIARTKDVQVRGRSAACLLLEMHFRLGAAVFPVFLFRHASFANSDLFWSPLGVPTLHRPRLTVPLTH